MIAKNTANRPDAFQAGNVLVTALGHFMHDIYTAFLAPILIILALLAFLIYYIGPAVITTFIYAGV